MSMSSSNRSASITQPLVLPVDRTSRRGRGLTLSMLLIALMLLGIAFSKLGAQSINKVLVQQADQWYQAGDYPTAAQWYSRAIGWSSTN